MTQNAFLQLLRQYAQISQRKRRSYAKAVNEILRQRHTAIMDSEADEDVKEADSAAAVRMAQREYGVVDPDFTPFDGLLG